MNSIFRIVRSIEDDLCLLRIVRDDQGNSIAIDMQSGLPLSLERAEQFLEGLVNYVSQFSPAQIDAIRRQIVEDDERETKRRTQKRKIKDTSGFVYLIQSENLHKIGISKAPLRRISTMQTSTSKTIEIICIIESDDMRTLESALHTQYADKRIRGEWFDLSIEDVNYIKGLSS